MQHELKQLQKLIERKKEFLDRCEKPKMQAAIKAEINIIQKFIQAAQTAIADNPTFLALLDSVKRENKAKDTIKSLECICIIHGINDYPALMNKDLKILMDEVLELRDENQVRVPEKLKAIIF